MFGVLRYTFGRYVWAWLFVWGMSLLLLLVPGPFELWDKMGWQL